MLPPGLNTPREVKQHYNALYDKLIDSSQYQPFVYPSVAVGATVILGYLLIDHRKSSFLQALRLPLYGFLCAFSAWCITTRRARHPAAAYGNGLLNSWGTLWCGTIMFFNDCQVDFKRIEHVYNRSLSNVIGGRAVAPERESSNNTPSGQHMNGNAKREPSLQDTSTKQDPPEKPGAFFWQSYPAGPFIERLDWVLDLFCSFQGVGWNVKSAGIPPVPEWVEAELSGRESKTNDRKDVDISSSGLRRFADRQQLLRYVCIRLVIGFFALDAIKTLMHHDPYFWGYTNAPAPAYFSATISSSPVLVKSYRLLLSLAGIHIALLEIFRLGPLFFCGVLGPQIIGTRGEAWMNPPDFFGSISTVFDKGLAGWWGGYWHQTFRYAFEAPAQRVLEFAGLEKRSPRGRIVSILVAFTLSGCLHACGSYTQLGDTRPFAGPFRFFLLQAAGIILQATISDRLQQAGIVQKTPKPLRQLANFTFAIVWLYNTAHLLTDDFSQGGVWLYEPIAFSPLRAIGLGAKDDRSWDLWLDLFWWRNGENFWDTGIAF